MPKSSASWPNTADEQRVQRTLLQNHLVPDVKRPKGMTRGAFCHWKMRMTSRSHYRRRLAICVVCTVAIAVASVLTIRSYSYSDSFAYCHVTIATDEGLVSITLPFARLAKTAHATKWETFARANTSHGERWVAKTATKFRLREYMAILARGNHPAIAHGDYFGFGYLSQILGASADSNQGRIVLLFAPIWAIGALGTLVFCVPLIRNTRIGVRWILCFTAGIAFLLWIPTLIVS